MLDRNNIEKRQATTINPQSNAICERMHQIVGNSLRILRNWHPPLEHMIPARSAASVQRIGQRHICHTRELQWKREDDI
jgi:hypothetical protein